MFGAFRTGEMPVFEKRKGTLGVFVDNVLHDCITLSFKKVSSPKDVPGFVILDPKDFSFS